MTSSINAYSTCLHYFKPILEQAKSFLLLETALSRKVYEIAMPHLKAGYALLLCGYSSLEIYVSPTAEEAAKNSPRIVHPNHGNLPYLSMHGGSLLGTGLCCGLEALHDFSMINLGRLFSAVSMTGGICWLFANFVALEENLCIFKDSLSIEHNIEESKINGLKRQSAIWGILSNIGYIIATTMALFGTSAAMALLLGIASAFFGGVKMLYDLLLWSNVKG